MFKRVVLDKRPDESFPENINFFKTITEPIPTKLEKENQILVKVLFLTIDPVMRVWLSGAKTYISAVNLNQPVPSFGIGEVIMSNSKKWQVGSLLWGPLQWAEYCYRDGEEKLYKIPEMIDKTMPQLPLILSAFGNTGLTAYNGLNIIQEHNKPKDGSPKTLAVSSAAGSTGSYVIQIAKHMGFRVVAIFSSEEKMDFVKGLGADACVCYNQAKDPKTGDINVDKLTILIKKQCPEGINVFYDNAGEEVLDAVLPTMSKQSEIVLCGATATYNSWKNRSGLKNTTSMVLNSIKAQGILFYGVSRKNILTSFFAMLNMYNDGHLKTQEEWIDGLEEAPMGLQKVFMGRNKGKIIIRVETSMPIPESKL